MNTLSSVSNQSRAIQLISGEIRVKDTEKLITGAV
jgi:hypothetical protein